MLNTEMPQKVGYQINKSIIRFEFKKYWTQTVLISFPFKISPSIYGLYTPPLEISLRSFHLYLEKSL